MFWSAGSARGWKIGVIVAGFLGLVGTIIPWLDRAQYCGIALQEDFNLFRLVDQWPTDWPGKVFDHWLAMVVLASCIVLVAAGYVGLYAKLTRWEQSAIAYVAMLCGLPLVLAPFLVERYRFFPSCTPMYRIDAGPAVSIVSGATAIVCGIAVVVATGRPQAHEI